MKQIVIETEMTEQQVTVLKEQIIGTERLIVSDVQYIRRDIAEQIANKWAHKMVSENTLIGVIVSLVKRADKHVTLKRIFGTIVALLLFPTICVIVSIADDVDQSILRASAPGWGVNLMFIFVATFIKFLLWCFKKPDNEKV